MHAIACKCGQFQHKCTHPSLKIAVPITPDVHNLASKFERCFELTVYTGQTLQMDGQSDVTGV